PAPACALAGDRGLDGRKRGPCGAVDPQEAALEPVEVGLVDQAEEEDVGDGRVAAQDRERGRVVAGLEVLPDRRHVLLAEVLVRERGQGTHCQASSSRTSVSGLLERRPGSAKMGCAVPWN